MSRHRRSRRRWRECELRVTNFAWDWIYQHGRASLTSWLGSAPITLADGLLRLPLHGTDAEASAWQRVEDVPLIARKARRPRDEVRLTRWAWHPRLRWC
jgi:hypothetical protein